MMKKIGRNYAQQIEDVEAVLPEIDFYLNFYGNPVPFDPKLVATVSTEKEEFLPMISPDNELPCLQEGTSSREKVSANGGELTMSDRTSCKSPWGEEKVMPDPFNTIQYSKYGGVSISIDNHEMYLCACQRQGHILNCDLFVTHYKEFYDSINKTHAYQWSDLKNLGPNVNGQQSWGATFD